MEWGHESEHNGNRLIKNKKISWGWNSECTKSTLKIIMLPKFTYFTSHSFTILGRRSKEKKGANKKRHNKYNTLVKVFVMFSFQFRKSHMCIWTHVHFTYISHTVQLIHRAKVSQEKSNTDGRMISIRNITCFNDSFCLNTSQRHWTLFSLTDMEWIKHKAVT